MFMYYPYLRGKMYELIAIRDLINENLIDTEYIHPIIEPVKDTLTFQKLIDVANDHDYNLNIIVNPNHGNFEDREKLNKLVTQKNFRRSLLVNQDTNIIEENRNNENTLLFIEENQEIDQQLKLNKKILVAPHNLNYSQYVNPENTVVVFKDCFPKKKRNSDYLENDDERFSTLHLLYRQNGYKGFGDYSIVGNEFSENGFAPYAVVIHIVYFDENNRLNIHHFVSDSNDGIKNPGLKFNEALQKFEEWYKRTDSKNKSNAAEQLIKYLKEDKYPGLGVLKKIGVMHHLEIMNRYLKNEARKS